MQITKGAQTYDFEKWPKWRQLDTSIELLVLEGESVLEYQREGGSLYLFMEGGTVHMQDSDEPTSVDRLVIECTGITDERFDGAAGAPAADYGFDFLSGSIPIMQQNALGGYEKVFGEYWFDVDANYSGRADLSSCVRWEFKSREVRAYWKER
ncbi:MAG: hypothetical protein M3R04_04475 [bacterium]|nr:hypothetical protein [bacterium]